MDVKDFIALSHGLQLGEALELFWALRIIFFVGIISSIIIYMTVY
jgi:hypothetical protein